MSFDPERGDFARSTNPPPADTAAPRHPPRDSAETSTLACGLTLRQVLSARLSAPVRASLAYDAADPYAVSLAFHPAGEETVSWVFSRDLLLDGIRRPTGCGDVRVWPSGARRHPGGVWLAFESPAGRALFEAEAVPLQTWLTRTCRLVPPGTESRLIPWDDTIQQLMSEGA